MIKYIVQIDMSEFGEPAIWQDVYGAEFYSVSAALSHIAWMEGHYGHKIKYQFRTEGENDTVPAYYEADGGSMCNGIGRSYF